MCIGRSKRIKLEEDDGACIGGAATGTGVKTGPGVKTEPGVKEEEDDGMQSIQLKTEDGEVIDGVRMRVTAGTLGDATEFGATTVKKEISDALQQGSSVEVKVEEIEDGLIEAEDSGVKQEHEVKPEDEEEDLAVSETAKEARAATTTAENMKNDDDCSSSASHSSAHTNPTQTPATTNNPEAAAATAATSNKGNDLSERKRPASLSADEQLARKRAKWRSYKKKCSADGCTKFAQRGGVCMRHGSKYTRKLCSLSGCTNQVVKGGVCKRHGAKVGRNQPCTNAGVTTNQAAQQEGTRTEQGGVCFSLWSYTLHLLTKEV